MTGLDLEQHYGDVVRIVHAKFSSYDVDLEDLSHDVCLKILKLNRGSSPYDAKKSSASTYIYMVARGVLIKKYHKEHDDPPANQPDTSGVMTTGFEAYLKETLPFEDVLPRRVFLLLKMGYTRSEIAHILGESLYQVREQKKRLATYAETFIGTC